VTEQQTAPPSAWQTPARPVGPAPGVEFGDFGPRLVAYIIDGLIVFAVVVLAMLAWVTLWLVSGGLDSGEIGLASGLGLGLVALFVTALTLAYFPWFWARRGATPGMKAMGLKVVRDADGGPISGGQAVLRLVGYWISGAVFYLGYIWILVDKRRRGWHDLIAGTVVIKAPTA
jgi:uncharacterized RDD family membrane protein YckC